MSPLGGWVNLGAGAGRGRVEGSGAIDSGGGGGGANEKYRVTRNNNRGWHLCFPSQPISHAAKVGRCLGMIMCDNEFETKENKI